MRETKSPLPATAHTGGRYRPRAPIRRRAGRAAASLIALLVLLAGAAASASAQPEWVYNKAKRSRKKVDREITRNNPLLRSFDPEYTKTLLDRIGEDVGYGLPGGASIYALRTRRRKESSVFVVKVKTGDGCGDKYTIFKRTNMKYTELLRLECAEGVYFAKKKTTTNGLPDLLYVSERKPDDYYSATFRFDGERYEEHECQVGQPDPSEPNRIKYEMLPKCKGRGIVGR